MFAITVLAGDVTLDNIVDGDDGEVIGNAIWDEPGMTWTDGDVSNDGMVNYDDLYLYYSVGDINCQELFLLADLDGDLDVDDDDIETLVDNWGMSNPDYEDGDLNGDNVIDQDDLDIAYALFGLEITAVG